MAERRYAPLFPKSSFTLLLFLQCSSLKKDQILITTRSIRSVKLIFPNFQTLHIFEKRKNLFTFNNEFSIYRFDTFEKPKTKKPMVLLANARESSATPAALNQNPALTSGETLAVL